MENFNSGKIENWVRNSVTLKLVIIGALILILLVPSILITELISERQSLQSKTIEEVSSEWAHKQTICAPLLTIPFKVHYSDKEQEKDEIRNLTIAPDELVINGKITPVELHRGIYNVAVYDSKITLSGSFKIPDTSETDAEEFLWDKAFLTIGISDNRGIKDEITVDYNGTHIPVEPGTKIDEIPSGVTAFLNEKPFSDDTASKFSFALNLQGSNNLSFVPLGSKTDIRLSSNWENPSFRGAFLPDNREVTDSGFTAHWNILELNRNFPSQWVNEKSNFNLSSSATGVDLLFGVEDYQKSMRSAKYAVMIICITFLVIFLVEILNKMKIHPFQYTLVGLALCLFYVLLISISEHLNFNSAYWIATVVVVSMITFYAKSVFKAGKTAIVLAVVLLASYSFLFVLLQLSDYALLVGSIGLTFILAATMYFTRNVNWYNLQWSPEGKAEQPQISN